MNIGIVAMRCQVVMEPKTMIMVRPRVPLIARS
jgi:hypothetical protein